MRLSERIALGSLLLRPIPGIVNDLNGGGCAFGMAHAASGTDYRQMTPDPWLRETHDDVLPCDCGKDGAGVMGGGCSIMSRFQSGQTYLNAIVHLFNYHVCTAKDWTLEQLIDWVRSVEPDEAEETVPVTEVIQEALAELVTK